MKRILALVLCGTLLFVCASCTVSEDEDSSRTQEPGAATARQEPTDPPVLSVTKKEWDEKDEDAKREVASQMADYFGMRDLADYAEYKETAATNEVAQERVDELVSTVEGAIKQFFVGFGTDDTTISDFREYWYDVREHGGSSSPTHRPITDGLQEQLASYQGTWQDPDNSMSTIVVKDEVLNFVFNLTVNDYVDIEYVPYWFGVSADGQLIVEDGRALPYYFISPVEDNKFNLENLSTAEIREYIFVSDSTEMPEDATLAEGLL